MALERELAAYQAHLAELLQHPGEFVLISGDDVIDYYATYDDALTAGYQQFRLNPFLVKRVDAYEHALCITREIYPIPKPVGA